MPPLGVGLVVAGVLAATATPVQAAPPDVPVVLGPTNEATGVKTGDPLAVRVADADAQDVDVTFHLRRADAGAVNRAESFTWVAIPDTQNYVAGPNRAMMGRQTQWIADHAGDLGVALVSHLGDIVGSDTSRSQFEYASSYLATLDAAGVPNTVLPGNHDMNLSTGNAPLYDEFFPVSRYAAASWNGANVRYAGYYGQDQFGDDPRDRRNMDSYVLLTAGGMDLLVLNLEFNPPDDVLAWADRVIDAHPNRRVMVVTHSMLSIQGAPPSVTLERVGGNSPAQVWTKLIAPNCSVFMVISGHDHGEAHRTMRNDCQRPVHLAVSDYQADTNGGDGYLRYYTFKPAANTIAAYTYSPVLDRFQTDADSRFDLPLDMSVAPSSFEPVGQVTATSGSVASMAVPALVPGARYEWFAEASDGSMTARSAVTAFSAHDPDRRTLARDGFDRTLTNGWGSADKGGSWTQGGLTSRFATQGGQGRLALPANTTTSAWLEGVSGSSVRTDAVVSVDKLFEATYVSLVGRRVGSGEYFARLRLAADGGVRLNLLRNPGTALIGSQFVPGFSVVPGRRYRLAVEVTGVSPSTVRAKVWPEGEAEPGWQRTGTDSTAGMQVPGAVGVWGYLPGGAASVAPLTVSFDSITAVDPSIPVEPVEPPANVAPVARLSTSVTGLSVAVDGGASSDADGTVVSYAWDFGDGATGTGRTTSHAYTSAGTYAVRLTVTDDDGATAVASESVVIVTPPSGVLAEELFDGTTASGWGSAEPGGPWTLAGGASRFRVGGGAGAMAIPAGGTLSAWLEGVSGSSVRTDAVVSVDKLFEATYVSLVGRRVGSGEYFARLRLAADGGVRLNLLRNPGTALIGSQFVPGFSVVPGRRYRLAVEVTGVSPSTVRAKVWPEGEAEPGWQRTGTDSTAGMQVPGAVGVWGYLPGGAASVAPLTVSFDSITAVRR